LKILYVSQYFPPEMGAPAARVSELSRYWVGAGHQVTVLTGFPNHPTGEVPLEYRSQLRKLVTQTWVDGVRVVRTWLLPFPNRKPYERVLNYVSFCLSAATTGMFVSRPDLVIGSSPQLLVALSAWWIALCKRVPFIFEVRDLWPESLVAVGVSGQSSYLSRLLMKLAGFLYRRSTHIVVVTPAFKDYLIERWKVSREKISVVGNGVETSLFSPRNIDPNLRHDLQLEGKFVVSYIGTLGMAHGLESLLEAAAILQHSFPQVVFLLVGEGADKDRIRSSAQSRNLTNVRFLGQQPRERVPAYIGASDACLVLLRKAELFKTVIPTKMLEFMACARPIILGVDGQAREIMEEADSGVFVEPEDVASLVEAVTYLLSNPSRRDALGGNGRRHILQGYSRRQTSEQYLELLESLLGLKLLPRAAAA
jgi:glycosyltransferase involved in cell wall biosynthesis